MLKQINGKSFAITAIAYFLINLAITYLFAEPNTQSAIFTMSSLLIKLVSALVFAGVFELFFRSRTKKMSDGNSTRQ
jgi:hypothetical protein